MHEELNVIPETADTGSFMKAGLHLVKIHSIETAMNEIGLSKMDKNGNPGLKITFENKDGDLISQVYYYSPLPLDHPDRLDDSKRCKSEFRLTQLKKAFGFGSKPITISEIKSKKCWMAIRRQDYFDTQGDAIMKDGRQKSFHQIAEVWPMKDATANDLTRGRPVLKGDPEIDSNNFFNGFFYEIKVDAAPLQSTISRAEFDTPADFLVQEEDMHVMADVAEQNEQVSNEDW